MNQGSYFAFGLNHTSAPVSVREAFELSDEQIRRLYEETNLPAGTEWIVLSTCNRTEIYFHGDPAAVIDAQAAIERLCGKWPEGDSFTLDGREAIRHVLEVVSGLRSQVLGDAQILNQVKEAYRAAVKAETVGPRLHRLMHTAFATAKKVISTTALGSGGSSIARAAVDTLRKTAAAGARSIGDLSILVLGCGGMGTRILKELSVERPAALQIANRTSARAARVAERHGAHHVPWDERGYAAARADVVFAATGAQEYVLSKADLDGVANGSPTLVVDISVPRNVDPTIEEHASFTLVNIDELNTNGNGRQAVRRNLERAQAICDEAVCAAAGWEEQTRAVAPAVRTLHETFEQIRSREVERNIHRFRSDDQQNVERLTRSIMQKLIAIPIVRLKALADSDDDLIDRLELLNSLFDKGDCDE